MSTVTQTDTPAVYWETEPHHHPEGGSTRLGFWIYLMSDCLMFALVGTHGLHVLFGCIWLVTLMVQVNQKGLIPANTRRMECLSMFWHFLDVIWIGVFTFVYLLGMI